MPASVEKTYADALLSLAAEENGDSGELKVALGALCDELDGVNMALAAVPDFIRLMNAPTVPGEEKAALLKSSFEGKISGLALRFLLVVADKKRMGWFDKICRETRRLYNEQFGIMEIVVTTTLPLDEEMRGKIAAKMAQVTGKTVKLREKTDKSLIGGIVIDCGNTRLDGSVKTRLEALKQDIAGIIA